MFIEPMLCQKGELFEDRDWIFEVKLDGERGLIEKLPSGEVNIWNRRGVKTNTRYPELVEAGAKLPMPMILDGEIVAYEEGKTMPSFKAIAQRSHLGSPVKVAAATRINPVSFLAFDLLEMGGASIMQQPLRIRQMLLDKTLPDRPYYRGLGTLRSIGVERSRDSEVMWQFYVQARQGEGLVAKRLSAHYQPGKRSADWLKIKAENEEEFIIIGYTAGEGNRQGKIGALLLGGYVGSDLRYVGKVGTGFTVAELAKLEYMLGVLHTRRYAPVNGTRGTTEPVIKLTRSTQDINGDITWVKPKLVCQVRYLEWTDGGRLRFPSYLGLRNDRLARDIQLEPKKVGVRDT